MIRKLGKNEINIFGEASIAHVEPHGNTYAVVRECDSRVLATGKELKGFLNDIIRTMYTGYTRANSDYILWSADKQHAICKFK